ncbi:MAG TPA: hypothetical protein PKA88_11840 [Polyangiaceae bacterium]|nr:hypothetical protein [Polyangiaceae bacterium]
MRTLILAPLALLVACSSKSSRDVIVQDAAAGGGGSGGAALDAATGGAGPACEALGAQDEGPQNASGVTNGKACTVGADCQSGYCVEGVCCNSPCQLGPCHSCKTSSSLGSCTYAKPGTNPRCDCPAGCDGSGKCGDAG